VAEAELASVAVDEIQTDGENNGDANVDDDPAVIRIHLARAGTRRHRHRNSGEK
jgi:hypothetical protein